MDVTLILMKIQLRGDLKRTIMDYDFSNEGVKLYFEAVTLKIEFSVHI